MSGTNYRFPTASQMRQAFDNSKVDWSCPDEELMRYAMLRAIQSAVLDGRSTVLCDFSTMLPAAFPHESSKDNQRLAFDQLLADLRDSGYRASECYPLSFIICIEL